MNTPGRPNSGDIEALLRIMEQLRDPAGGCPWDLLQNFRSIAPYTLEEAYEVADAIEREAWDDLRGELGDLLFQVVYHAQMAREAGLFDFPAVVAEITDKMIKRHPHVFADATIDNAETQTKAWEAMKAEERAAKSVAADRVLNGVPLALPALTRAAKLQRRAACVGFDWPSAAPVYDKIEEELTELRGADDAGEMTAIEEELGDLLFACVNLSRHLGVDPEAALRQATAKFQKRFEGVEEAVQASGRGFGDFSLEQLDGLWRKVKSDRG